MPRLKYCLILSKKVKEKPPSQISLWRVFSTMLFYDFIERMEYMENLDGIFQDNGMILLFNLKFTTESLGIRIVP